MTTPCNPCAFQLITAEWKDTVVVQSVRVSMITHCVNGKEKKN